MSSTQSTDVLSSARGSFENSKKLVEYLLRIHEEIGGDERGKRAKSLSALNMSAMVLITACWESYLKTLLSDTFKSLLDSSDSPEKFSKILKKAISDEIKKNKDDRYVWKLTGDGWKDIFKKEVKEKLDKFNTPSGINVNKLFEQILGLKNLSECWSWQNMSRENRKAVKELDRYLLIRNKIAHGETKDNIIELEEGSSEKIDKQNVTKYMKFIEKLIEKTEKKVKDHL